MAVGTDEWLKLISDEYLRDFIAKGGAAVKFVVLSEPNIHHVTAALEALSADHDMAFVKIDSAEVKLHLMHDVFFSIARNLDWERDAQTFVEGLFRRNEYIWPSPGK